ncbi:hypothetical protein KL935_003713 [Ogataea polymorpha]|uniref:Uncharacterized protein n=1 Tax=Ogataea polymorpha TaxID=460523 RepID=A0A1B7SAZ8_9ASCO|nr:uncharacterized protein OGAPODRAFT_17395 [Ogataea polymorpha]KAG7879084.1 hypothetical protein KL937_003497 [Ogataea polymorpha]KAG7887949.1 hypothetical protein KL936_003967 [Ogataea polymorpha]KAG7899403.1 hypothetical protein KL935_003713 [Ogataea polymorpha]KAG7915536.1 hypothetical protein KL927_003812 [Ogataea polymorpha]KAG7932896.1 hypothetical protein KL934_003551 [Ogataea polymorpha]
MSDQESSETRTKIELKEEEKASQETSEPAVIAEKADQASSDAAPPPMPKRPVSAAERAIQDLKEAFPTVEEKYVKMALIASQGQLDPAFNALLFLSDPSSDIPVPVMETKPKLPSKDSFEHRRQLESDEALARRLAREYEKRGSRPKAAPPKPKKKPVWAAIEDGSDDEEDFVDSLAKNVEEARNTVGGWVSNLAKKIQKEVNTVQQGQGENQLFNAFGRKSSMQSSRSRDDSQTPPPPPVRPPRPQKTSSVAESHKSEELEEQVAGIKLEDATTDTKKKHESISAIQPEPVVDDTFAVDDSDEEDDKKEEDKEK